MCAFTASYKKPTLQLQDGDNDDGNSDVDDDNATDPHTKENNYNDFGNKN